jgi:hypothetical protein
VDVATVSQVDIKSEASASEGKTIKQNIRIPNIANNPALDFLDIVNNLLDSILYFIPKNIICKYSYPLRKLQAIENKGFPEEKSLCLLCVKLKQLYSIARPNLCTQRF